MHTKLLLTAFALTASVALTGCSGQLGQTPPAPEPEVLSATEAGGIYLDAVCPVNVAWDEADIELDRLRLTVSRGEADTRRFAAAMEQVGLASKAAAKALDPDTLDGDGHVWPASALDEIAEVRATLLDDEKQAADVAKLPAQEATIYSWKGADAVGAAAHAARDALGLPEDGANACAQWHEQTAEAREPAAPDRPDTRGQGTTGDGK